MSIHEAAATASAADDAYQAALHSAHGPTASRWKSYPANAQVEAAKAAKIAADRAMHAAFAATWVR